MLNNPSYEAARRTVRIMAIITAALFVIVLLIAKLKPRLEMPDRVLFTVIGTIPPLFFTLAVFLYDGRHRLIGVSYKFRIRTIISLLVLFAPATYILLRHIVPIVAAWGGWPYIITTLLLFIFPTGILDSSADKKGAQKLLFLHIREIMWWPAVHFDSQATTGIIAMKRAPLYIDSSALQVFQATWKGRLIEATTSFRLIDELADRNIKRILDIGGGDGDFTRRLLQELKVKKRLDKDTKIVMVDPIDWEEQYSKNIKDLCMNIHFLKGRFGEVERSLKIGDYDLVIASHSLYGLCDPPLADREAKILDIVKRIKKLSSANGITLIILASLKSRAYEFKKAALSRLFGQDCKDIAAEDLRFLEPLNSAKIEIIDGLFDLTELLGEWRKENNNPLISWMRYFLRAPIKGRNEESEELANMLGFFAQRGKSLSEEIKRIYPCQVLDESWVLAHKTQIWLG